MALLSCENLVLGYDGVPVLSGVRFELRQGDYLCIVGENGSGKSTLMKTVLGLQKPLRGTITFGDGLKQTEIGYLPQQTAVQKDFPATVVYSQVYNMMNDPESYLGKVIRMAGYYSAYEDTERGVVYHACIIPDATACCAPGIEFVWGGEHVSEDADDIVVTGRLELYEEDGLQFLHLVDSDVQWEKEKKERRLPGFRGSAFFRRRMA